jgi:hypothetical protein
VITALLVKEPPMNTSVEEARRWYEKARGLGSTEAAVRLDRLRSVPIELWR